MRLFTVPGWPARVPGHSAVTPALTPAAGSGWIAYKDQVTGQPGTVPVTVDTTANPRGGITAQAMMGTSRSADAPDGSFRPNLYFARPEPSYWPGAGMPVRIRSDNLMPVPAVDPRGVPARMAAPLVLRGNRQIGQPAQLVMWPSVTGS